jgi:hypothetical protein
MYLSLNPYWLNYKPYVRLINILHGRRWIDDFFRITQYNVDVHTRMHTHPYDMYANPTSMSTSKDWAGRSWGSRSHHRRLVVDGDVIFHWKHSAVKSWNKSRKIRAPMLSRGLNPGGQVPPRVNWLTVRVLVPIVIYICEQTKSKKSPYIYVWIEGVKDILLQDRDLFRN